MGGHEKFILCEFERGTGARKIHPSLNKVRSKKSKGFSGRNRKFKRFFRPKTGDLQKKRSSFQKRHKIWCQSTKNTNLDLDLRSRSPEPVNFFEAQSSRGGAQFLFGGHKQSVGGARPRYAPPGAPGLPTTHGGGFTLFLLIAERQAGKLWIPISIVFGLTRLGIEAQFTVSVADAPSTDWNACSWRVKSEITRNENVLSLD